MSDDVDYEGLGFKAGLEIHQQLSGKKLFCACPTELREDEPHFSVTRSLRASAGESGRMDLAASHEQRKAKRFVYQGYQDTTCLVELDEEPISAADPEAVSTAAVVGRLLGMTFVDEVHPMRKVVVDGSNTSGFQRTMLCALNGVVKDVRVERLCLEEDACKIVSRGDEEDVYNLSRLGIPLLEITTAPDIKNPQHLQEIAAEIGMVLRSTGRIKRGLGSIRQDVNISIQDGTRVEIKGVQDLYLMPLIAENEVRRQASLVALSKRLASVTVGAPVDVSSSFANTDKWVSDAIKKGDSVVGIGVPELAGLIGEELFTSYRVGTEIAGYAKAWGFGGIIHSDEDPKKYGLPDWQGVVSAIGSEAFILAVGRKERVQVMLSTIISDRVKQLAIGVPSEVRKANDDGTTTYLRPMPGADRMYPETDARPFTIKDVQVVLPELISSRIPRIASEYGVSEDVARQLCRAGVADIFEEWAKAVSPSVAADVLVVKAKEMRSRHKIEVDVAPIAPEILARIRDGAISKDAVESVLLEYHEYGAVDWDRHKSIDEDTVRKAVKEVIAADPGAPMGAHMGAAMKLLGSAAEGKTVSRVLREELGR